MMLKRIFKNKEISEDDMRDTFNSLKSYSKCIGGAQKISEKDIRIDTITYFTHIAIIMDGNGRWA